MRTDEMNLVDVLRAIARTGNAEVAHQELEHLREEDIAEAFLRMEVDEQLSIMRLLDAETASYILVELPTETARNLLDEVPDEAVAHYLDILPVDDAIELRDILGEERFDALLEIIPIQDAQEIRRHLTYPEDSAGQLMATDFLALGPDLEMNQVLALIRLAPESIETVNYLYVLSPDRHLLGVLTLRRVLRAAANAKARDIMNVEPVSVNVLEKAEDAAQLMARYGFAAMPVLDERARMVGIITADDAQDVLTEAATEDVLKLGAVSGDADSYLSLSVFELIKRRLPWLVILFVAETLTGAVLRHYIPDESSAQAGNLAVIAKLTLFIPLLIGAGGNSGSQVTTTITRALAVGEVKVNDYWRVLRREIVVALCIGLTLGMIGSLRAYFGWNSGADISIVVGVALPAIILWSTLVSSVLPLTAKRFGQDPAVMSAPFISTFVDATGLVIYFEIARVMLGINYSA